ncbi:MAG: Pyrophosphate--fructose 6-phosphate 1-phosphotransferase [Syntrophomonadaceae bacterium]|nr:Pyrophosphate--fructose 6-phosphate 1-phosphotransferase [Bacillota bacterium]
MKVGVLTGGGDAPGLNAAIRAIVVKGSSYDYHLLGIKNGWAGLLKKHTQSLSPELMEDTWFKGGTLLGTSRTNPYKEEGGEKEIFHNFKKLGLDALIAIGGEDTLGVANKLAKSGMAVVGVPKTIDNDLSGTDYCIGFDTAMSRAAEAIGELHSTARSHHRVMVVEIMGRHAGWLTLQAGLAGGAHLILIPEVAFDIKEIMKTLKNRYEKGLSYAIVAVAEGAKPAAEGDLIFQSAEKDAFGHVRLGGIAQALSSSIEEKAGIEARSVVLGHIQRGGRPTAADRIMAMRVGAKAIELVHDKMFGQMASVKEGRITSVPIKDAVSELKTVDVELYKMAKSFFKA